MDIYWGLSYGHHDAAIVITQGDGTVLLAERANAKDLDNDRLKVLYHAFPPNQIFVHENKKRDMWRKIKIGDWSRIFTSKPWMPIKPTYGNHHLSHAAAAYYTSGFKDALVIVADAIGEQECLAVYSAHNGWLGRYPIFVLKYPHSLGLFYSYHAARIGLQPNSEERVMMAMSRLGNPTDYGVLGGIDIDIPSFKTKYNMHRYPTELVTDTQHKRDIAATAQKVLEEYLIGLYNYLSYSSSNLVFTGGVAYNTLAVEKLKAICTKMYVPTHPGDAGSAYGAILQHTHQHITLPKGRMYE